MKTKVLERISFMNDYDKLQKMSKLQLFWKFSRYTRNIFFETHGKNNLFQKMLEVHYSGDQELFLVEDAYMGVLSYRAKVCLIIYKGAFTNDVT